MLPGRNSVLVLDGPREVGALAAELIANRLRARPRLRLLLPTGHTPLRMYEALRSHAADGSLPAGEATVFQLDEYRGLKADHEQSYRHYLRRELEPIGFGVRHELAGDAAVAAPECARYQALLDEDRIDIAVLGLGRDGHVAFDEPGSLLYQGVHEVALHPTTRRDAAADFGSIDSVPEHALTVGLRTLQTARELLLLVTGEAKAQALDAMLEQPPSSSTPASLLAGHPRLTILCDRAAARLLEPSHHRGSDHVLVVLGHREPGVSAEHRISNESLDRLRLAERLVHHGGPARAVVLTGYTSTGGLSEAEQMALLWTVPDVPVVLELAGRDTAENATRSLPLIVAMGGVRAVTVVTSAWHLRARYFFAPYRRFGVDVTFRSVKLHGSWGRMLAHEFRWMPAMRSQRRHAFAEMRLAGPRETGCPPA